MNNRLYEIIIELKKSQVEFAKIIGFSKTTYGQIENGMRYLKDREVISICNRLFLNENWLRYG